MLYLRILLQLVLQSIFTQQYQDVEFVIALHVSVYLAIIRWAEILGNC